ncbi:methyltransferase type 11 [Aureimonas fodinaquatilis]|uniref:Methyltransferase type 11 n=2 Tax=Aureimonas fodinaquatilis TaxID=2565783 RepID=A0A5B0DSY6_9HYPH|nr:methyltransferase type 11 [Aureimonas fodinaquatilis]
MRRGDMRGFMGRARHYRREAKVLRIQSNLANPTGFVWGIMTTPHTLFIARCIGERLAEHGIESEIFLTPPEKFNHDCYIVLCAQMFDRLPPNDKRVVFQLEQSVSSRWFTPEYLKTLASSLAVLDYSLVNIEFLAGKDIAYPHVHYLPIGIAPSLIQAPDTAAKDYDFIFYGDYYSSPRRERMLEELQKHFTVKLCNNAFDDEMHALIRKARAVINIHYYENALLEMPRIQECLALGVPVLSESSRDQAEYPELGGGVQFFEQDNIEDMLRAASAMLKQADSLHEQVSQAANASARRFSFMFDRFLLALRIISPSAMLGEPVYVAGSQDLIALSLPETIARRRTFEGDVPVDCAVFDGIRNVRGWVGCGSSFSALARLALADGRQELTVFEDDVLFKQNFDENIQVVRDYLAQASRWDIFSGMMASVHPDARVLNVEHRQGMTFVTLDHMTSMVFNIYNRHALEMLAGWNPLDLNVDTNAIDRYLEKQNDLHVVVALPFLVGHREDVRSTLWGFENDRYAKMIAGAEARIQGLVDEWQLAQDAQSIAKVH